MRLFLVIVLLLGSLPGGVTVLAGDSLAGDSLAGDDRVSAIETAAGEIDRILRQAWQRDGVMLVDASSDAEFCRRVWLDLCGVAPPVAEVRRFLEDSSAAKRERLIDRLLTSPRHARHMADRWIDILLPEARPTENAGRDNTAALHRWLQDQFADNTPYDYLVGGFLTAGGAGDSGPAVFYTSYDLEPKKLAAATSRIFMGIQLQCAECHNHPTDRWTQEDFWQYAAFFAQLRQADGRMGPDTLIEDQPSGEVTLPDSDRVVAPRYPGMGQPPERDPTGNRRRQLTIWMASRDNPYFARAAVNRVWAHLFGRGLVEPVDAMDIDNRPSHPQLLEYLARFLVERRFDLRDVYAAVARSEAYGRTSRLSGSERPPADTFAAMNVKTLTARQYFDSLQQNVFLDSAIVPQPRIPGRSETAARQRRDQFLARMRAPGASPRDYPHGVVQILGMMNGPEITAATNQREGALMSALEAPFFDGPDQIETLFLATLSRPPTESEKQRFSEYLQRSKTDPGRKAALSDLLWVLLNTAECAVTP